jgi:hypothetical protein
MATKTITLELDAYEKLKAAKRPRESFSDVVRRAQFQHGPGYAQDLLDDVRARAGKSALTMEELHELEQIQKSPPPPSPSHWDADDAV